MFLKLYDRLSFFVVFCCLLLSVMIRDCKVMVCSNVTKRCENGHQRSKSWRIIFSWNYLWTCSLMGNYSSIISLTAPISGEEVQIDITVVRFDTCLIFMMDFSLTLFDVWCVKLFIFIFVEFLCLYVSFNEFIFSRVLDKTISLK